MKKNGKILIIILVVILSVFMLAGCVTTNEQISVTLPENYNLTEITAQKVLESNVVIQAETRNATHSIISKGSGVILTSDGYILTNKHVISGDKQVSSLATVDKITVEVMRDGYSVTYRAKYITEANVGKYSEIDLAIIKIDAVTSIPFKPIELGSIDTIKYGTPGLIIGNPKGLGIMVSNAMVSSPKVEFELPGGTNNYKYIALNADVNSGNSGGGMYDYSGKLIGIVTLREVDDSTENSNVVLGIGYAIRVDEVSEYLKAYPNIKVGK